MDKICLGISSCLLGHNVRYDGGPRRVGQSDGKLVSQAGVLPPAE